MNDRTAATLSFLVMFSSATLLSILIAVIK